jgi:hypothetical protein
VASPGKVASLRQPAVCRKPPRRAAGRLRVQPWYVALPSVAEAVPPRGPRTVTQLLTRLSPSLRQAEAEADLYPIAILIDELKVCVWSPRRVGGGSTPQQGRADPDR